MTQFLVDTNVLIWLSTDDPRINQIKSLLFSENSQIFFSAVSLWEITIKIRSGKLPAEFHKIHSLARQHHFHELPITSDYMKAYLELPHFHKDPFDHMLLAQAITCPMRFVTGDSFLAEYSSLVITV